MPPRISALLLAAGSSTRMGQPKALLPLKDQPTLLRCLATLLHGSVWEIIVILGPETEAAAALLEGMPIKIINNTLPQSDMAKSVRLGFPAMNPQSAGALVFPVDHPLVQPETLKRLVAQALEAPETDNHSHFSGTARPSHPVPEGIVGGNLSRIQPAGDHRAPSRQGNTAARGR